jgi:iron complex outermembrane receptor protein
MNTPHPARISSRSTQPSARLVFLFLPFLPVVPLAAQGQGAAPAPQDEVVELSRFTVSADSADRYRAADAVSAVRVRSALIDTPSTISVITRDMMNDLAPNRVFDVTRYIAGVQEGRGIQFQDRMIIRGFETQNGARTVDNFLQSADADNIEESVIDRIEVTKGPNAILSPAGAPGGSLNIITKSPVYREQRSLTAQVGLFDAQKAVLDMAGPFSPGSPLAYRFIASGQDSGSYWSSDAKKKNWSLAPMLAWRIGDKSQLTVKVISADHWIYREPLFILSPDTTAATHDPQLLPGIDPSGLNGIQPWSHVGTRSDDVFVVFTTSFDDHLSLRVAGNGRRYFEDSDQNFLSTPGLSNRYDPTTGVLTQDFTWALQDSEQPYNATTNPYVATHSPWIDPTNIPNRGDFQNTIRKTVNLQADLAGNYRFGPVSSQTIAGAAYSRQFAYNQTKSANLPGIDLLHHIEAYPEYPADWTANNGSSYTNTQIYLSERLGLLDDRLYLTGGILNYSTVTKAWNELIHGAPNVLDDDEIMWSAGALYKIRNNVSLYYSHSTNASPVIANNQPLWREGLQDEFGVKTEFFGGRFSVNASYFEISQTNVTVPNPAYQTDPTQPQTLVSDLSNKGFEVEAMGSLTKNLSAIFTYSHLNMRDALDRNVRAVADNNAALLLNYRFDEGAAKGLALILGVTYSGKRAGDVPDGNFTQLGVVKQVSYYLKPQYLTTVGASYRLDQRWSFQLNIDNPLNDADYISVAGGRISGTGLTTQPGINVRFSTRLDF